MSRPLRLRIRKPVWPATEWRWTLRAGNGYVVDASTQGYARRAGVDANVALVLGLDVTGLKPGENATYRRYIGSHFISGFVGAVDSTSETEQTIRVEVR